MKRGCLRTLAPAMPRVVLPMPGVPMRRGGGGVWLRRGVAGGGGGGGGSGSSTTSQQARSCLRISFWPIHSDATSWGWERGRVTPWIWTGVIVGELYPGGGGGGRAGRGHNARRRGGAEQQSSKGRSRKVVTFPDKL